MNKSQIGWFMSWLWKTIKLGKLFLLLFFCFSCQIEPTEPDPACEFAFSNDIQLSDKEQKADSLLDALRERLLLRQGSDWELFRSFQKYHDQITADTLYQLFQQMPKGGLLHAHASALCDVDWLIDLALSMPECYIFWDDATDDYAHGQLACFPDQTIPDGWVPIQQLNNEESELAQTLYQLYTLNDDNIASSDKWVAFESCFQRVDGFISYQPVFVSYYEHAFESLASDGIQFVELRTSLDPLLNEDGSQTSDEALLDVYNNILQTVQETYPSFGLSIIGCSWRGNSIDEVALQVERMNGFSTEYPGLLVGFDLVGEEDTGHSNGFFATSLCQSTLPLFLHSGESLSSTNANIQDAVDLGASRISHAINLFYFPELYQTLVENGTLLELCPISNQLLGYVNDFRLHPSVNYLQEGIQATLGSDDPALFQSRGLTDDYYVVYLAWNLDLRSLKKMLLNSITFSGQDETVREEYLSEFTTRWNSFITLVTGE